MFPFLFSLLASYSVVVGSFSLRYARYEIQRVLSSLKIGSRYTPPVPNTSLGRMSSLQEV